MRLTACRPTLLSALRLVGAFAPKDAFSLRLTADHDSLELLCEGESAGVNLTCEQSVAISHKAGTTNVPRMALTTVVAAQTSSEINLSSSGDYLCINCNDRPDMTQRIPLANPVVPFPKPPENATQVVVTTADLRAMLSRVAFAVARKTPVDNEGRSLALPLGINVQIEPSRLALTGTDVIQLASVCCRNVKVTGRGSRDAIVPLGLLQKWTNHCPRPSTTLVLWKDYVQLETEGLSAWSRCVDGIYPPWEPISTKRRRFHIVLPVTEFVERWRIAGALAGKDEPVATLLLSNGMLRFQSQGDGEHQGERPVNYTGPDVSLTLSLRRFAAYLGTLPKCGLLRLEWSESAESGKAPIVCRLSDGDEFSGTYLIVGGEG
jgi:hypothetical protein